MVSSKNESAPNRVKCLYPLPFNLVLKQLDLERLLKSSILSPFCLLSDKERLLCWVCGISPPDRDWSKKAVRPTVQVMVSSLLVPPPPPMSEGATTGTTMRRQHQNSWAHMLWVHTNNANPHRLYPLPGTTTKTSFPLRIQYQCAQPCQVQHLKSSWREPCHRGRPGRSSLLSPQLYSCSTLAEIIVLREITVGLWFPFHNWISRIQFHRSAHLSRFMRWAWPRGSTAQRNFY